MGEQGRELHCYDYVNKSYAEVRAALTADALVIFRNATRAAADHAQSVAATLRTSLGPIDVGADVEIEVEAPIEEGGSGSDRKTRIPLRWKAARAASLFPRMAGTLLVYPLTGSETQLELCGTYQPPFGVLGAAMDGLALHRVAEASVMRFVSDVARYLGAALPAAT